MEDRADAPILADHLRARTGPAVGGDQDGMGFLAERVTDERGRSRPDAPRCVSPRSSRCWATARGDPRTGRRGARGRRRSTRGRGPRAGRRRTAGAARSWSSGASLVGEPLEPVDIELEGGVPVQADRVLIGLEPHIGVDAGRGQARADEPERLAQARPKERRPRARARRRACRGGAVAGAGRAGRSGLGRDGRRSGPGRRRRGRQDVREGGSRAWFAAPMNVPSGRRPRPAFPPGGRALP